MHADMHLSEIRLIDDSKKLIIIKMDARSSIDTSGC